MKEIPRQIDPAIRAAAARFPVVVLTGPRRAGKTWLLQHMYPEATYVLLEDPDIAARASEDPQGFLDGQKPPVILDEIQRTPELFRYVRSRADREPDAKGRWFLTGSQESTLMQGVTESMAGRAAILRLLPVSLQEDDAVSERTGGFPEVLAAPADSDLWFSSYVQTYLERDVRDILSVRNLATFRRFLGLLATRHGQMLNKSDLAAPLGISVPTVTQWLNVLELSGIALLVLPYYENAGKRLVKKPKFYFADSGLVCHLLRIRDAEALRSSPFAGPVFEGFVATEIVKAQINRGEAPELYYFRDEQGLEVDFVIPGSSGSLHLVECKASATATPDMARPAARLAEALRTHGPTGRCVETTLVYKPSPSALPTTGLLPGVKAVGLREFLRTMKAIPLCE